MPATGPRWGFCPLPGIPDHWHPDHSPVLLSTRPSTFWPARLPSTSWWSVMATPVRPTRSCPTLVNGPATWTSGPWAPPTAGPTWL